MKQKTFLSAKTHGFSSYLQAGKSMDCKYLFGNKGFSVIVVSVTVDFNETKLILQRRQRILALSTFYRVPYFNFYDHSLLFYYVRSSVFKTLYLKPERII